MKYLLLIGFAGLALAGLAGAAPQGAPAIGGCAVFPLSNAWNQRVDKLPVAANSAAIVASIGLDTGLHPDFGSGIYDGGPLGFPYVLVHGASTPKFRVAFDYADESDRGPYPIPRHVPIEGGRSS